MKKLFALMLALMMAISCVGALAEQSEPAAAVEDLAAAVTEAVEAAAETVEEQAEEAVQAVADTADALTEAVTDAAEEAVRALDEEAVPAAEAAEEAVEAVVEEAIDALAEELQALEGEEEPAAEPERAVRAQVSYTLGSDFINNVLTSRVRSGSVGNAINGLVYLMDKAHLDVISCKDGADIAVMVNDKPVLTIKGVVQDDGIAFVSNLFPSYALKLNMDEVAALAQKMNLPVFSRFAADPAEEAVELTEEELAALQEQYAEQQALAEERMAVLRPYLADLGSFVEQVQQSARFSDDFSSMNMELTSGQLNDLITSVATRLSTDYSALSFLQNIVDKANAVLPADRQMSVEALVSQLLSAVQQTSRVMADQPVARLSINNHADGTGTVEVNGLDRMLVTRETTADGTVTTILLSGSQITDGSRMLGGLRDGSNSSDTGVVVTTRSISTESGTTALTDADAYIQGLNVQVHQESSRIGASEDTVVNHRATTISLPQLGGDVFTYSVNTCNTDVPALPSLDGLKELRVNAMTNSDRLSLLNDIMNNGFSAVTADVVRAMPDEVANLLESRVEHTVETGEGRGWINTTLDEDDNKPIELTGLWSAENSFVEIRPDGSCTVNYNGITYEADYMNYEGTIFLTHESTMVTGTYTRDTMTLNFGFEAVEYTR